MSKGVKMVTETFRNSSHWGAFYAEVENGRVKGVRPFEEAVSYTHLTLPTTPYV